LRHARGLEGDRMEERVDQVVMQLPDMGVANAVTAE